MINGGKTIIAGVLGWPVSHSLSPRVHGYWLREFSIDGAYIPLPVGAENLAKAVAGLRAMGFVGVNVTSPHKQAILELVDEVEDSAARTGSANTLVIRRDGALRASSTDGIGFLSSIRTARADWMIDGPAVILGAGGAAKAIAFSLMDAGVTNLHIVNRSSESGEFLAKAVGNIAEFRPWSERTAVLESAALLVNATSLGMVGAPALDLVLDSLPSDALVVDIVYTPLETNLLREARARGNPVVDGLGMLLHQAVPGFSAWFGRTPKVTPELRTFVLEAEGA